MTTTESETDTESRHTHTDTLSLVGGGEVTYTAEHRRKRSLDSVVSKIDTAVEMAKAHSFNQAPRQRNGPRRADTEYELTAIRKAVEDANDNPSFSKNVDGDLEYVVEEGYYPDDYQHLIDVTDIPKPDRSRALLTAQSNLCRRGYVVNSLRSDDAGHLTHMHVVTLSWVYNARAYGKRQAKEAIRDGE